jgi:hypothetical protein
MGVPDRLNGVSHVDAVTQQQVRFPCHVGSTWQLLNSVRSPLFSGILECPDPDNDSGSTLAQETQQWNLHLCWGRAGPEGPMPEAGVAA